MVFVRFSWVFVGIVGFRRYANGSLDTDFHTYRCMSCIRIWESSVLLSADNACVCVREMDYCSPAPPSYNVAKISVVCPKPCGRFRKDKCLFDMSAWSNIAQTGGGGERREKEDVTEWAPPAVAWSAKDNMYINMPLCNLIRIPVPAIQVPAWFHSRS